jgi:hypothetical protein
MAEVLLISRNDLVALTALGGSVDSDKFIQFIKIAQDIHVQNYLGTNLLQKIQEDILNDDLEDPYLNLVVSFIKPLMIHWAMVEYLPFAAYTIANKGVYKHSSENAVNVDKVEVDYLVEKERQIAQNYTQRFLDHMSTYGYLYPEYNTNASGDVFPQDNNYFNGWYL